MLSALAVFALVVGSISATVSVNENGLQTEKQAREPVAEVKAVALERESLTQG
jgi:hypothetical protein